jgi:hypothetical protein
MAFHVDLSKPHVRVWLYALAVHAALFSIFYGPNGTGVLFIVVGGGVIFALVRMYHDTVYNAQIKRGSPLRSGDAIIFGIAGLLVGWLTARAKLSVVASGKWIWIVPVPLFVCSFLHNWLWRCQFCPDAKTVYFYSSAGLDGMLTWPAFSLSGYSIGSWIANRMRVQPRPPALL